SQTSRLESNRGSAGTIRSALGLRCGMESIPPLEGMVAAPRPVLGSTIASGTPEKPCTPTAGSALVGAPTSGGQHHINDARVVVPPKADAPVAHSQPPLTRKTLEWADVAYGEGGNRDQKALALRTRQ